MKKQKNYTMILLAIVSSIFITAIDVGIIAPARTTIATSLKVNESQSIWVMTAFSLATAASMLIWSILSDKYGKKKILIINLVFFVISSVFCGLTNQIQSYTLMIISRAFQGFFSGGIIPIATSYIATEFPIEKKGMAMGMVGATFSIGTIIGPTAGSAIIDWLGQNNWGWLFYINIIFGFIAIPMIIKYLEETNFDKTLKIEVFSITSATITILGIMLFFTNIDFTKNFQNEISKYEIWIPASMTILGSILTVVLTRWLKGPLYVIKDLFKNKTMALSLICVSIGAIALFSFSIYLPQISESFFKLNSGKGGYYSTIIGLSGIIFGPVCGNLISSWGPKKILQTFSFVLIIGLGIFYTSLIFEIQFLYFVGLFVLGASQSAVMGLSFNYFIQLDVEKQSQASAQSMLALFRSVSGAVGPALTVIFIKNAANNISTYTSSKIPEFKNLIQKDINSKLKTQITSINKQAQEKISNLINSNKNTKENIINIKNMTKHEISNTVNNIQSHVNIPKIDSNSCLNISNYDVKYRSLLTQICDTSRIKMLNGFENVVLFAIISAIIVFTLTFFFKKFDMKKIMSEQRRKN